jgi:hypothetical protein
VATFKRAVASLLDVKPDQVDITGVSNVARRLEESARNQSVRRLSTGTIAVAYVVKFPLTKTQMESRVDPSPYIKQIQNKMDANASTGNSFAFQLQTEMRTVSQFSDVTAAPPVPPTEKDAKIVQVEDRSTAINAQSNSSNTGGVIGGVCGGLAFLFGVVYFYFYQRKMKKDEANEVQMETSDVYPDSFKVSAEGFDGDMTLVIDNPLRKTFVDIPISSAIDPVSKAAGTDTDSATVGDVENPIARSDTRSDPSPQAALSACATTAATAPVVDSKSSDETDLYEL